MFYLKLISGNLEIGNGYGVPVGRAYHGAPLHSGKNIPIKKLLSQECFEKP